MATSIEWGTEIDRMFQVNFTDDDLSALKEALSDMRNHVDIYTFIDDDCRYCNNTVELIETISRASPTRNGRRLLVHNVIHRRDNSDLFKKFNIVRVPSVALLEGYIRYTGMPAGEEIRGLVETIIRVSNNDSGLSNSTVNKLATLRGKVHVEVVVTPTCPYCPYAALIANMFAFESYKAGRKAIISDTVEAYENPDIADRYNVMSVPALAINGNLEFVGLPYEEQLLERVIKRSEEAYSREVRRKLISKLIEHLESSEEQH